MGHKEREKEIVGPCMHAMHYIVYTMHGSELTINST